MSTTTIARHRQPLAAAPWFESWFESPHARRLYAHHDDAEAAGVVERLVAQIRPPAGARVLDLGCGRGRHAKQLAARGFDVTGLDLSVSSLHEAQRSSGPRLHFHRQDMRSPFGHDSYDCVFSMFTSFGYFNDLLEHLSVVRNIARALKPGGTLVLDYLNVAYTEAHLRPRDTLTIDGHSYDIARWATETAFFKRIRVDARGAAAADYCERVAKFTRDDFCRMFALCGLTIQSVYGDYALNPYNALTSPRMILIVRKSAPRLQRGYLRDRFLRMRLNVSAEMPR